MNVDILLKVLLTAWLITSYDGIQWILEAISPIFNKNAFTKLIYNSIVLATSCIKCCAFYVGWIMGGFYIGCLASFIAYLYSQLIMPTIDKIRFQI